MYPLGDQAWVMRFGTAISEELYDLVSGFAALIERKPFVGLREVMITYTTVTVYYDPWEIAGGGAALQADGSLRQSASLPTPHCPGAWEQTPTAPGDAVAEYLQGLLEEIGTEQVWAGTEEEAANVIHIPVCYSGEYGPDLQTVAEHHGYSVDEVIELHTNREYRVYMLGFAPGFAYLGGMSEKLYAPRKAVPRVQIPAGSVGIGGLQTGIYPLETPGGWNIIGRTPLAMFRPWDKQPTLLRAGDRVRFVAIGPQEFVRRLEGVMQ